jgi:phosphate uptake regulator
MSWRELRGHGRRGLDLVEHQLLEMLDADRHTFDLAAAALLAGADPQTLREAVHASDGEVDDLVRLIRRELVVHAGVHGVHTDIPGMFTAMSVVKDIERIGDYAKELLALAQLGADLSQDHQRRSLSADRDRISELILEVRQALAARDADHAQALLARAAASVEDLETRMAGLVRAERPPDGAVAHALFLHYARRITAHLMNVLTSLVLPMDQLDFFDENGLHSHQGAAGA